MLKFWTLFVVAFCWGSVSSQANNDESTWIRVVQGLLELQKNYANSIGTQPEFGKRLASLIETVNAYIADARQPTVSSDPAITPPPGVSRAAILENLEKLFVGLDVLLPQTDVVKQKVAELVVLTKELKIAAELPQVLYICVPTRNVVFSG